MNTTINIPFISRETASVFGALPENLYDLTVIMRAYARAGHNRFIHGHIHEILFVDKFNRDPMSILKGLRAVINENKTAKTIDIKILDSAGKMVHKIQLKDCSLSPDTLIIKIKSGYYNNVQVKVTDETAVSVKEALRKSNFKMSKPIKSSGITTEKTKEIAKKMPFENAGRITTSAVGKAALHGGAAGTVIGVGIECITSGIELKKGVIGKKEFAYNVGSSGIVGGAAGAAGGAVSLLAAAGTATVLAGAAVSPPVWVPTAAGIGASIIVGGAVAAGGKWATTQLKAHVIRKSSIEKHAKPLDDRIVESASVAA